QYIRVEISRRDSANSVRCGMTFSILPKIIVVLLIVSIIAAAIWFYIQSDSDNEPTEIEENGGQITIRNPEDNEGTSNDSTDENDEPEETEEEPDEEIEEPEEMQFEVVETGTGSTPESTI